MPHPIWQEADTDDDRRGATENLYVQGYLRFWDALKERFPDLIIDSCAGGGRRNDIETMRRSIPLHQTDYGYGEHPVQQAFMQTLYTWIPYFRGFGVSWERTDDSYGCGAWDGPMKDVPVCDEFNILASFAPAMNFSDIVFYNRTEEEYAKARELAALFYEVAPVLISADFYALTPYHKSRFKWTSWQFDEPEKEHGIIEVIRNNGAPDESLTVSPRLRDGRYCFRNMRTGEEFVYEGGEITFRQAIRTVTLWEYRKI
jgi:alpha-galactosidase